MKHSITLLLAILLISALAVGACGKKAVPETAAEATSVPAQAAEADAEATEAPEPEAQEPAEAPEPTVAQEPTSAEEADLSVDDRQSGLDKLDSYKATWSSNWESTEKDASGTEKTSTAKWAWTEEFVRDPRASHVLWIAESSDQAPGSMEMVELGDMSYVVMAGADGEKSCIASTRDEADSSAGSMFNPTSLGSVSGAKFVGRENVNGIATRHYRYDEKGASLAGLGKVKGDIWVAADGDYVVKEATTWEGGGGIFGLGAADATGKGEWTWEVTEINQPIDIAMPAECKTASSELPILPDAEDKIQAGDAVMYQSATALAEVVEFYRTEMKAAGWQEQEGGMSTEDMAMLTFTKDNLTAQLIASRQDDLTGVSISIMK